MMDQAMDNLKQGKVSLGYCAQIVDMTKETLIRYLGGKRGVYISI